MRQGLGLPWRFGRHIWEKIENCRFRTQSATSLVMEENVEDEGMEMGYGNGRHIFSFPKKKNNKK